MILWVRFSGAVVMGKWCIFGRMFGWMMRCAYLKRL